MKYEFNSESKFVRLTISRQSLKRVRARGYQSKIEVGFKCSPPQNYKVALEFLIAMQLNEEPPTSQ